MFCGTKWALSIIGDRDKAQSIFPDWILSTIFRHGNDKRAKFTKLSFLACTGPVF